MNVIVKIG
jgi:hypothetical protein